VLVVAAALVRNGRVLAGLRRGGGWEFPGGKIEPGETPSDALARECREELDCVVEAVRELGAAASGTLDLRLWLARLIERTPTAGADHDEVRWVALDELDGLDWLPLDRALMPLVRPLLGPPSR
jgi:8-oxo-dGTP diphosphatase